jgi:thymidylate kinase
MSGAIAWIRSINSQARKPDLTLVLDVPADQAKARRRQRGGVELYDDDALQERLVEFYAQLELHFPDEKVVHVPGTGSIEQITSMLVSHVDACRG